MDNQSHPEHAREIPKINRTIGQLEGIKKMINNHRYCPDILIQLMASRASIRSIYSSILKSHLRSCVARSFASSKERDDKIDEIKKLFDQFE